MTEGYLFSKNKTGETTLSHDTNSAEIFNLANKNKKKNKNNDNQIMEFENHNIFKAYKKIISHLSMCINDLEGKTERDAFIKNIFKQTKNSTFAQIKLDSNDDEQQIFDRTNSTGVELTTGELLKNYLFSDNEAGYKKYWAKTFESKNSEYWQETAIGGKRNNLETMLLSAIYIIRKNLIDKNQDIIDKNSNNKIIIEKYVLAEYKVIVKTLSKKHSDKKAKELVSKEIQNIAKIYSASFKTDINTKELIASDSLSRLLFIIDQSKLSVFLPYILYIIKYGKETDKNDIYNILEYHILSIILTSTKSEGTNKIIYKLIKDDINDKANLYYELKNKNKIEGFENLLNELKKENSTVTLKITTERLGAILYLIEVMSRDINKNNTPLLSFNSYQIEHIIPKSIPDNKKDNWKKFKKECNYNKDEMEKYVNNIGNFTLLNGSLNIEISDNEANEKIKNYINKGKGGLTVLNNIVNIYNSSNKDENSKEWGVEQVIEQQKWLAGKILEVWDKEKIWGK